MRRSAAKAMRADMGEGATFQVAGNITGALVKVAHRPDPEDDYRSEDQSTETGKKMWHLLRISPKALVEKSLEDGRPVAIRRSDTADREAYPIRASLGLTG
jgi:hypothetical protein